MNVLEKLVVIQKKVFLTPRQRERQYYEMGKNMIQSLLEFGIPEEELRLELFKDIESRYASAFMRGGLAQLEEHKLTRAINCTEKAI